MAIRGLSLPRRRLQCRRQEVGERARDHRAQAEAGEVVFALRGEGADPADLNPDRAEIREAAEGEGRNRERHGIETALHRPEMGIGNEFIEHHALAQQRSHCAAVMPRYTHHPRDRPEDPSQNGLQRFREPRHDSMNPAEQTIHQCDERDERDEHRDHVQHEVQPFARPARRGIEHVHVGARNIDLHAAARLGDPSLRLQDLRHHDRARCGHDDGGQEMTRLDPERDVGRHDRAGDVRHARGHHRH